MTNCKINENNSIIATQIKMAQRRYPEILLTDLTIRFAVETLCDA